MKFKLYTIAFLFCAAVSSAQNGKTPQELFLKPSLEYRMNVNRHSMPHDAHAQDSMIDWIIANGYGGMATNVNPHAYLKSDEEMAVFDRFVHAAKAKGLDLWLYDEKLYPSGMADTYILEEHPDWEAEGLFFRDSVVAAGTAVDLPLLPGRLWTVRAVPVTGDGYAFDRAVDLSGFVSEGRIRWTAPAGGPWCIAQVSSSVLYEGFQAGTERGGVIPRYTSLLLPEVTQRFIELTHERYAGAFKEKLGQLFTSTFTDEPSSMALPFANPGYGVYPWKRNVSDEFRSRYGCPLEDVLLEMMLDRGPQGQKQRYRYFRIVSDFMSRNYFRQVRTYCNEQKLLSGGHLLVEESMMAQVPLYGSIMACYRELDIPGIDVLTGMPSFTRRYLYSSRLASSAAELNGSHRVMTESCPISDYNFYGGKEAPSIEIKGTLNRQMIGGVTDFNNYLQLQHEDAAGRTAFNDYVARVVSQLAGGVRASRIAVYYPVETLWTKYRPLPSGLRSWDDVAGGAPEAQRLSSLFDRVSDCLMDNGWEFSYVDGQGIEESKVDNGYLVHGNLRWDVLVLPGVETLSEEMFERISAFAADGGKVVVLETLPMNSFAEFPCERIVSGFEAMLNTRSSVRLAVYFEQEFDPKLLNDLLEGILPRDIVLSSYRGVLHCHRKIGGRDVYFIVNDTPTPLSLGVSIPAARSLECWNPQTGQITPMQPSSTLALGPYEGMIVRRLK